MTTTHRMLPETDGILLDEDFRQSFRQIKEKLQELVNDRRFFEIGRVVKDKMGNPRMGYSGDTEFQAVSSLVDVVLIEADGSRRLPVKVPSENEPVIFEDADLIFVLEGLSAVGKRAEDVCHRWEKAKKLLGAEDGHILRMEDVGVLLKKGYLEPLREKFPRAQVIPVLNQADTESLRADARALLIEMGEETGWVVRLLDEEQSVSLS